MPSTRPRPLAERFWEKVSKSGGCWLWAASLDIRGYGRIALGRPSRQLVAAHRVSWEMVNGAIPDDKHVLHHCDTPACVRPDHLFLGTAGDNSRDMVIKGRSAIGARNGTRTRPDRRARGTNHGRAKLSDADVLTIRTAVSSGAVQRAIARQYDISPSMVSLIVKRKNWQHI